MPRIRVVSFYTRGPYALEAQALVESGKAHGVAVEAFERGPFPSWREAVCHKPRFIREQYEATTEDYDGLLWMDADARFMATPPWGILDGIDYAITLFRWSASHPQETLTGTLYFRKTNAALMLLQDWERETERWAKEKDTPEQKALAQVHARQRGLAFLDLPLTWTWILPEFDVRYPGEKPFIVHMQASRRFKY